MQSVTSYNQPKTVVEPLFDFPSSPSTSIIRDLQNIDKSEFVPVASQTRGLCEKKRDFFSLFISTNFRSSS